MRETLDRLSGGVPHQGVIAVVSAKPVLTLEQLLEAASDPALLVALDGVEDPRNLGAILRSVEAAGADGALLPERHSAGLSETVGRSSAGAMEHVRVAQVGNLVQALETLKSRGVWVIGFDASGRERWDAVDLKQSVCLVLGGEGRGIRRLVREHCDHLVSIPHSVTSAPSTCPWPPASLCTRRCGSAVRCPAWSDRFQRLRRRHERRRPTSRRRRERPRRRAESSRRAAHRGRRRGRAGDLARARGHPRRGGGLGQGPTVLKPVHSRRGRGAPERRRGARRSAAGGGKDRREAKGGGEARQGRGQEGTVPDGAKLPPNAPDGEDGNAKATDAAAVKDAPAAPRTATTPSEATRGGRCLVVRVPAEIGHRRGALGGRDRRQASGAARPPAWTAPPQVGPGPASRHPACITLERLLNSPFVAGVAQLVEQRICKPPVGGSNPSASSSRAPADPREAQNRGCRG